MIAREGMAPLAAMILAGVLVLHFIGLPQSLVFWALALLVLVLFRDPERDIPSQPLAVVSPADGKVTSISAMYDPYLLRESIRVTIQMPPYGVFTTRSPIEGKVLEPPNFPADDNIPHGVWLQSDEGDDVVMVMTRGPLKNEPRCYIRFGDRIGQGKRCGFVHLGGRVEIYLPERSRLVVKEGDVVQSGSDIIAKMVHT
ncbi:MAG: phosphatidylserine decarboxylase [Pseudomonadota bacterium]